MLPPRLSLRVLRCPPRGLNLLGAARRCVRWLPRPLSLRVLRCPPRGLNLLGASLRCVRWLPWFFSACSCLHLAGRRSPEASLLSPVQTCNGRFGAAGSSPEGPLRVRPGKALSGAPAWKFQPRSDAVFLETARRKTSFCCVKTQF